MEKRVVNQEISEIILKIVKLLLLSGICAFIGYRFCKDLEYNVYKGIILGIVCPWGYVLINKLYEEYFFPWGNELYNLLCLITVGIFAIVWLIIKVFISAYFGLIAFPILITYYICEIFNSKESKENIIVKPSKDKINKSNNKIENSHVYTENDEYYCERCYKKITEKEYDDNDGLCLECYEEVNSNDSFEGDEDWK